VAEFLRLWVPTAACKIGGPDRWVRTKTTWLRRALPRSAPLLLQRPSMLRGLMELASSAAMTGLLRPRRLAQVAARPGHSARPDRVRAFGPTGPRGGVQRVAYGPRAGRCRGLGAVRGPVGSRPGHKRCLVGSVRQARPKSVFWAAEARLRSAHTFQASASLTSSIPIRSTNFARRSRFWA
jgi:hypothetical protein